MHYPGKGDQQIKVSLTYQRVV